MSSEMSSEVILTVSFGTSYKDTREKTIGAIEKAIGEAYPQAQVARAFTSGMVIKKIKAQEGLSIPTVAEALQACVEKGVEHITVQPTHVIDGVENQRMLAAVREYSGKFQSVKVGAPLLDSGQDFEIVTQGVRALVQGFLDGETAVLLMGHGSDHPANASYGKLQQAFDKQGDYFYVGTVEGIPTLADILERLAEKPYRKVILLPFMIVAGDHATNDMAGGGVDSWKSQLSRLGYDVTCILMGLGEYDQVQQLFVQHVAQAEALGQGE